MTGSYEAPEMALAIVGMAGRFPGARSVDEFWAKLRAGVEAVGELRDDDLVRAGVEPGRLRSPSFVRRGGRMDDLEAFAAPFFGFSPREAALLDPQQRHFLECAYTALEHAGHDPSHHAARVGVYASVGHNLYLFNNLIPALRSEELSGAEAFQLIIANGKDSLATRACYELDLRGPGITVQTACSSSLVAVHLACDQLLGHQCDLALAGGVSFTGHVGYTYEKGGILSPDGRCRPFDADAEGTVGGSGVGVVVLKRLEDALRDGDTIHAVIRGSAINNDGSQKAGFTAPSVQGQVDVISAALGAAGVDPGTIGYVEAHGTATRLGDPIEVTALTKAFRAATSRAGYCALGSIKGSHGHMDAAAGVAGLLKAVLALEHGELPPSLHFRKANPALDLEGSPFYVNASLRPFPREAGAPRRAGVSSFGIGGTNAHVILEEAPPTPPTPATGRAWSAIILSARTGEALRRASERLAAHLRERPDLPLADVAYTLQVGRKAFAHRRFVVCRDALEAAAALLGEGSNAPVDAIAPAGAPRVVFMFPGGGAQWSGMGRELYRSEPDFRAEVDRASEILRGTLGADLRDRFFRGEPTPGDAAERPSVALPALFVMEHALARLWMRWGVEPAAMIGHSLGEYTAACLAGVLALEDALALVALRGRLFERTGEGAMLGVSLPEAELAPLLGRRLSLAAVNGPGRCVVSGPREDIDGLAAELSGRGVDARRLHLDAAGHSALLEPILDEFEARVAKLSLSAPRIPYVSNLTGTWIRDEEATSPRYWARHMRETVRFGDGLAELAREPGRVLLEVGPGNTLGTLARRFVEATGCAVRGDAIHSSLPHAKEPTPEPAALLHAAGRLWGLGVRLDWAGLHRGQARRRVPLPGYPFDAEWGRYWITPPSAAPQAARAAAASPLGVPSWTRTPWPDRSRVADRSGERWLVLGGGSTLGERCARRLEQLGAACVEVSPGERFERLGERHHAIRPGSIEDAVALVAALGERGELPERVLYLALDRRGGHGERDGSTEGEGVGEAALSGVLSLVRALSLEAPSASPRLLVVLSGSAEVTGAEVVDAGAAALEGLCAGIARELPHLGCEVVDIERPAPGSAEELAVIDRLLAEAQRAPAPAEARIAYRGQRRFAATLEPIQAEPRPLAKDRAWIVSGELGALGLSVVESLGHALGAGGEIVVAGSPALPPRSEWGARRAGTPADPAPAVETPERRLEVDLAEERAALRDGYARIEGALRLDGPEDHPGLEEAMNRLAAACVVDYLARSGVETRRGAVHDRDRLKERLGILPKFDRLYRALLAVLRAEGIAADEGARIRFTGEIEGAEALRVATERRFPRFAPTFALLARCAHHYPEALTGRMDPHVVLYPDGRHDSLPEQAAVITNDPICQALVVEAVARLARRSPGLRILEVGGGTGILTWPLAEALRGSGASYLFTDLGRGFVVDARRQAARRGYDFIEHRALDIAKDPWAQGLPPHGFDIVLAYNVIHATPDIRASVRNLRALMAPGGLLFQVQTVHNRHYINMIFGLAEGWWYFDDAPLRTEGPFIEASTWIEVLGAEGLRSAEAYPRASSAQKAVLVAQQPGDPAAPCFRDHLERQRSEAARTAAEAIRRLEALEQETGVRVRVAPDPARAPDAARWRAEAGLDGAAGLVHVVPPLCSGPIAELTPRRAAELVSARLEALRRTKAACAFEAAPLGVCLVVSASPDAGAAQGQAADLALDRGLDATVRAWRAGGAPWAGLCFPGLDPAAGGAALRRAQAALADEPRLVATDAGAAPAFEGGEVSAQAGESGGEPPLTDVEARVAALWREVLGVARVRASDSFFELGGDSLVALQLLARLRSAFGVELTVDRLFERPTLAGLAALVAAQQAAAPAPAEAAPLIPAAPRGKLDLTSLLAQLDDLSDADVERLLAAEGGGHDPPEGEAS